MNYCGYHTIPTLTARLQRTTTNHNSAHNTVITMTKCRKMLFRAEWVWRGVLDKYRRNRLVTRKTAIIVKMTLLVGRNKKEIKVMVVRTITNSCDCLRSVLLTQRITVHTVCLTSFDHPQIGGKFTTTPGELTNSFYGCKDEVPPNASRLVPWNSLFFSCLCSNRRHRQIFFWLSRRLRLFTGWFLCCHIPRHGCYWNIIIFLQMQ